MSFDAEVLATYLAALSELASLKEVILGLPSPTLNKLRVAWRQL
jgi:hypothetical protein